MISVFALAYMLFAPLTAWLLGNVNRKHILQLALVLFIAGNLACAWATSYLQISFGRVLAALGAACYTPQAAAAAVGLVAENAAAWPFPSSMGHDVGYCARYSIRYLSRQTDRLA